MAMQVFTIFIGDDKSDEDAFRVFTADSDASSGAGSGSGGSAMHSAPGATDGNSGTNSSGGGGPALGGGGGGSVVPQPGLGILVSEESRATHAAYTLRDPSEVAELLSRLVHIGRSRRLSPVRACCSGCAAPCGQGGHELEESGVGSSIGAPTDDSSAAVSERADVLSSLSLPRGSLGAGLKPAAAAAAVDGSAAAGTTTLCAAQDA